MNQIKESSSREMLEQRNSCETKASTYAEGASFGTLSALNTIDPHEITPRIDLYIVAPRRASNPDFRIIKPKTIQTKKSVPTQKWKGIDPYT